MILKAGSRGRGRAGGERWPWQAVPSWGTRRRLLSTGEAADICGEGINSYPTPKQKSRARAMLSLRKFVIFASGRKDRWVMHSCQWVPSSQIQQRSPTRLKQSWICPACSALSVPFPNIFPCRGCNFLSNCNCRAVHFNPV